MQVACPLCSMDMNHWNVGRRRLHINACCEKAITDCVRCPACHKSFSGSASRAHLKQCAAALNMSLLDLMALSECHRIPQFHQAEMKHYIPTLKNKTAGNVDDDLQTALALSLSVNDEDKRRRSEAEASSKVPLTELGPPSHLLLTKQQRQAILSDRLAALLLQAHRPIGNAITSMNDSSLPPLWVMAAGDVGGYVSESSPNVPYYVKALVPPLSPTTITWGENLLSLSQLPGRSSSHSPAHVPSPPNALLSTDPTFSQTQGFILDDDSMDCPQPSFKNPVCPHSPILIKIGDDSGSEKSKPPSENPVYGNRYLSMVGESSWSDAVLILDDGQRVPVHKFVFAAWGIVSSVFPSGACSCVVSGITAPELFQLLALLYRGDERMLCQDWNNQSRLVQDKLRSWGVRLCANAKSPHDSAEVGFFSTKQNSPRNVTTDEQIAHLQLPSTSSHNECSAGRSSELTTPVVSGSIRRQPEPQFSRDLFSSPWESMCIVSHPTDVEECTTEKLSVRLQPPVLGSERQCHSISPKRSPKLPPAFDEQPTPCPLFKRLCASNTPPSPESEPPNQQSSVISPPNLPSPAMMVNTATPHLFNGLQEKSPIQSPPHIPLDSMSDINFGSWSSPLSTFGNSTLHNSPVTPLPDYKAMMTPELKRALSAFGVRPLPRKRAVTLLNEIYHQLHQYTVKLQTGPMDSLSEQSTSTGTSKPPLTKRPRLKKRSSSPVTHTTTATKRTCKISNSVVCTTGSASCSTGEYGWSEDDAPNDVDNRFEVDDVDDSQRLEATGQVDIKRSVIAYIRSQKELYKNILTYTPVEFSSLHYLLKEAGMRISARTLMDILDEQVSTSSP
ncbi:hypothetical protein CRM22_005180 [Opisthorchis felineus]|uniref:Structure-specific endonuclease subunit SLX4 n=1 Tax=Opisthorchis felineus TaxID=147828 RepID=A0A4S2LY27_OPIFE|nr:hypothetical protein CRM22_005180 [Opisthorchis felineus]TGZ66690.1 hypothetical protein CRM22_005180 [Opisthorchis felineus]